MQSRHNELSCVVVGRLSLACYEQGKVVQALQCAQKHQLKSISPETFLVKAAETGQHVANSIICQHCKLAYGRTEYTWQASRKFPEFHSIKSAIIVLHHVAMQCNCATLQVTYRFSLQSTECVNRQLNPALSLTTPARNDLRCFCTLQQPKHRRICKAIIPNECSGVKRYIA